MRRQKTTPPGGHPVVYDALMWPFERAVLGAWRRRLGARAGVYMPRGRSYLGLGIVYEYRLDDEGFYDRSQFYPEIRFAVGF